MEPQQGIFVEGSTKHWFCEYRVTDSAGVPAALAAVRACAGEGPPAEAVQVVVAFSRSLGEALLGADQLPPSFAPFAGLRNGDTEYPATEPDLLIWVHSDRHDRNFEVVLAARRALAGCATQLEDLPAFVYRDSRDLTGFIDGTENPDAAEGRELAVVAEGPGAGGAVVFTQRWVHDLDGFHALEVAEQEQVIGRTKVDSVELDGPPETSHVGRVVIEDDDGEEMEIYRRSVPYGNSTEAGLFFIAFPGDLAIIDAMLARMIGNDGPHDRVTDFSTAVSGAYLFAPSQAALEALVGAG